jgi:mono/diheme cytochrome c family protein
MPGFHERISRQEMDAVIAYIRTLPLVAAEE